MQNNTNDDLINTPKFRNIFQQLVDFFKPKKEPAALYEKQDPFEAIAGLNIKAIKNHISLKKIYCLVTCYIANN